MLIQMYKIASWTLLPDTSFLAIVYYDQASWTVPALATIYNTKAKVNEAEVKGFGSFTHVLWWICFGCITILGISFDMQLVAPGPTLRLRPHNFPYQKYRRKPRAASWLKRKNIWQHNINSLRIYHGTCVMETSELIPIYSKRIIALYMHISRKTEVEVVSPGILVIYKEVASLYAPAGSLPLQAPQGQSMLSPELGHQRSRKWSKVINSGPFSYSRPSGLRDSSTLCGCMKNYVGLVFISQTW